ncbi:MAG: hypothetical protein AB1898_15995 [Acidobacteriota bacterium]
MKTEALCSTFPFFGRSLNRRLFLKLAAIGAPLSGASSSSGRVPQDKGPLLPEIPRLEDLASDRMVHHHRDLFSPPAVHNEWGYLQSVRSVSGITAISFPPFSCCGIPEIPFSPGNLVTCELFLNGRVLNSYPPPAGRVAYTWYPHRVVRETSVQGFRFRTQTYMPSKQRAVGQLLEIRNDSGQQKSLLVGYNLRAGVSVKRDKPWFGAAPAEADNKLTPSTSHGCVIFEARQSRAISIQGVTPRPSYIEQGRMLVYELTLNPGETRTFHYLNLIGEDKDSLLKSFDEQQARFEQLVQANETRFADILQSAFTPGNSEFSGSLPRLLTQDRALWRLYYGGLTSLLVTRRDPPECPYGPTYVTVPRFAPTLSFIWDAMLTSLSLALLDPQALRRLIENWLVQDMHQHLATDFLSGKGMGSWYAVNDMGILRCSENYLRVTGDLAWLDKQIQGQSVLDRLVGHALYWKELDKFGRGLADYGKLDNLLEVVSTWIHEVPAMNSGNVYGMRFVASLLDKRGDSRASALRADANDLAARINRVLYVDGKGWWRCGQPDGTFNEVRHGYDLLTILDTMYTDLSDKQKSEMSQFFWSQLHTPLWMHALSPYDVDATWNLRADHSWLGAYAGWPSMTAKGLYKIDPPAKVSTWVRGLAKAMSQGPIGQAHIVETVFPPENGGAFKCPIEQPYGNDWCIVSGGSFTDLVIDSIFGVEMSLFEGIRTQSRLQEFDSNAKLIKLHYQGKNYAVGGNGATPE